MMRTQPDESPPDARFRSRSESKLGRRSFDWDARSSLLIERVDDVEGAGETETEEGPAFGGGGGGSPPPATTQAPPPATTQAPPPPATTAPSTGACPEGQVRCDSEKSWSMCGSGYWQSMGAVPGGMVCRNGAIVAARKRAVHNKGRWQHRSL